MVVREKENLRIRISGDLQEKLTEFSDAKRISKQGTIEGLLTWFFKQDELTQAMILGHVTPTPRIVEMILSRLLELRPEAPPDQTKPLDKIADRHGKVKREPTPKEAAKN